MLSLLVLLQAPDVNVLGVTVVTGDAGATKKSLIACGSLNSSDAPIFPWCRARRFPSFAPRNGHSEWEKLYGSVTYLGAWSQRPNSHGPFEVPALREGNPTTKAADEDAAHFLVRTVRQHPHKSQFMRAARSRTLRSH